MICTSQVLGKLCEIFCFNKKKISKYVKICIKKIIALTKSYQLTTTTFLEFLGSGSEGFLTQTNFFTRFGEYLRATHHGFISSMPIIVSLKLILKNENQCNTKVFKKCLDFLCRCESTVRSSPQVKPPYVNKRETKIYGEQCLPSSYTSNANDTIYI